MRDLTHLIGTTSGYLTVTSVSEVRGDNHRQMLICRCKCGKNSRVRPDNVTKGTTRSCGCYASDRMTARNYRHGGRFRPEYRVWTGLLKRCTQPTDPNYWRYGGRGIVVCPQWLSGFPAFFKDMGERPSAHHSIDRIDNDGNYEPSNCRWATHREQTNNRRTTIFLTIDDVTRPMSEWCEDMGLNYYTVWARIKELGWSHKKALLTPVKS